MYILKTDCRTLEYRTLEPWPIPGTDNQSFILEILEFTMVENNSMLGLLAL